MRSEESRAQRHVNKNGRESRLVAILGPMTINKSNITLKLANFCLSTLPFVFIINLSFLHEHVV